MHKYVFFLALLGLFSCETDDWQQTRVRGRFLMATTLEPVKVDSVHLNIYDGSSGFFGVGAYRNDLLSQWISGEEYDVSLDTKEGYKLNLELYSRDSNHVILYYEDLQSGTDHLRDIFIYEPIDYHFRLIDTNRFPEATQIRLWREYRTLKRIDLQETKLGDTLDVVLKIPHRGLFEYHLEVSDSNNRPLYYALKTLNLTDHGTQSPYFYY